MSRTTLDLWVGIFVALGFAALIFLAVKVGSYSDMPRSSTYSVMAEFDNIGGLKVRAPVKSAGVLVGRVGSIKLDQKKYRAAVRLDISGDYAFPADTTASILTSGLLGEQYIGLDAGGDVEVLKKGDSLMFTQSAVVLEKLIGQFMFNKAAETPPPPPAPAR
ncbi:MAG: outer membrane lipid asymmetry maintenance protein MlaD [Azoarcus sp.]|jgi:phospholipid/cholesterol/gamma-HCH transport system substrate-binding protein|nr:outer membrane lipid asymmetry maintenance protein MlaD [Azoarcus sp.]